MRISFKIATSESSCVIHDGAVILRTSLRIRERRSTWATLVLIGQRFCLSSKELKSSRVKRKRRSTALHTPRLYISASYLSASSQSSQTIPSPLPHFVHLNASPSCRSTIPHCICIVPSSTLPLALISPRSVLSSLGLWLL